MGNAARSAFSCYENRCSPVWECCDSTGAACDEQDDGPVALLVQQTDIHSVHRNQSSSSNAFAQLASVERSESRPGESSGMPRTSPRGSSPSEGSSRDKTLTLGDGSTYTGQLSPNGWRHGHGEWTSPREHYVGQWVDDRCDGEGQLSFEEGRVYRGQLQMGMLNGMGRMEWPTPDGTRVFEGEYVNQQRHGVGRYIYADGRVYTGTWVRGKRWGKGTFTFPNEEERSGVWKYERVASPDNEGEMLDTKEFPLSLDSSTMASSRSRGAENGHTHVNGISSTSLGKTTWNMGGNGVVEAKEDDMEHGVAKTLFPDKVA